MATKRRKDHSKAGTRIALIATKAERPRRTQEQTVSPLHRIRGDGDNSRAGHSRSGTAAHNKLVADNNNKAAGTDTPEARERIRAAFGSCRSRFAVESDPPVQTNGPFQTCGPEHIGSWLWAKPG